MSLFIEIRGRAEAIGGPEPRIRLHPERIIGWGLDGGGPWPQCAQCLMIASSGPETMSRRGQRSRSGCDMGVAGEVGCRHGRP